MRIIFLGLALCAGLAHADRRAVARQTERVRIMQDHAELAYRASGAMTDAAIERTTAVIDEGVALLRDIAVDPGLDEDERGRLYEEILRGARRGDTRGSLARVFWSAMTHHGADDVDRFGGTDHDAFQIFRRAFHEVFLDLKSLVTYRRDEDGRKIWTVRDRYNRERVARGLTVRFADLLFTLDAAETRSDLALDYAFDAVHTVVATGVELRRERVVAEKIAATFYAGMVVANVFGPMILPFVHFNWVGVLTGGAWGSAPISGATYLTSYLGATVAKLFTRTAKTFEMLRELERLAADPGPSPAAKAGYRAFRDGLLSGDGPLARHRRAMVDLGYAPRDPAAMSCEARLRSTVL